MTWAASIPWATAQARRSGAMSAAHTRAPSSRRTRRCFSPQRPTPTRRTFTGSVADEVSAQVLSDLIAEQTRFHPAHDEQIDEGHHGPVRDAVLGPAEPAPPVVDGDLQDAVAPQREQRGDEAVEAAV